MKKVIGWLLISPLAAVVVYFALWSMLRVVATEPFAIGVAGAVLLAAVGAIFLYRAYIVSPEVQEGAWVVWADGDRHTCCNCGLTHIVHLRIRGGDVEMMWQEDARITAKEQRRLDKSRDES